MSAVPLLSIYPRLMEHVEHCWEIKYGPHLVPPHKSDIRSLLKGPPNFIKSIREDATVMETDYY